MSSTTTTQPPLDRSTDLPAALFLVAAAFCAQLQHGLDRRILDTLPRLTWSVGHHSVEFAICLSEYQEADEVRVLPCQHVYHVTCVNTWFDSHSSCPTCRRDLRAEEDVAG
ncbi:RING-H2 finger protein ATL8-like protein [Tanacetum coccineum]